MDTSSTAQQSPAAPAAAPAAAAARPVVAGEPTTEASDSATGAESGQASQVQNIDLQQAVPSGSSPFPPGAGAARKEKKEKKKHKKHKNRDREKELDAGDAQTLKIRIKMAGGQQSEQQTGDAANGDDSDGFKKKKKKKKDKKHRHHHKEKRQKKRQLVPDETNNSSSANAKRSKFDEAASGSPAAADTNGAASANPIANLRRLLEMILLLIEKIDTQKIFANPVTDTVAPGYSQIIKKPMDFSTIRQKLNKGEYKSLALFKDDFELMCQNCMTYNNAETIYYKAAKTLLSKGQKIYSRERLVRMREQMAWMSQLTPDILGFDIMTDVKSLAQDDDDDDDDDDGPGGLAGSKDVSKVLEDLRETVRRPPGRFDAIPDDLTSSEILEQARKAAHGAKDRLRLYKPQSQMGFLRQNPDGTTSLSFLTGSDGVVPGTEKDRPVSLGSLIGKVKQGTGNIAGFREDRRNLVKTVHPLYYGAFSSHGPTYDSTFANLTKEESDLVYKTYGNDTGVQYAESILNFSRNCDYTMFIVDHLLDILTGYEHKETSRYIEEEKMLRKEDELLNQTFRKESQKSSNAEDSVSAAEAGKSTAKVTPEVDFTALKSLSDDGIDVSFLDTLQAKYEKEHQSSDEKLHETAELLESLKKVQNERLSQPLPMHFSHIPKASERECKLAERIQQNLTALTRDLQPGNIVAEKAIKRLLGIPFGVKRPEVVVDLDPEIATEPSPPPAEPTVKDEPKSTNGEPACVGATSASVSTP